MYSTKVSIVIPFTLGSLSRRDEWNVSIASRHYYGSAKESRRCKICRVKQLNANLHQSLRVEFAEIDISRENLCSLVE